MSRSGLAFQIESRGEATWVGLSGEFTEASDFAPLLRQVPGAVVLDLSGISRINSCGVREWVNFMQALTSSGSQVVLERCSVPVVAQLNMIANFRGNADVRSVFAPYFCGGCNGRHEQLVELGPEALDRLTAPQECPSCGGELEFDDLPESFLEFQAELPGRA
jgi:anti-anti-sigma regulatory factor